MDSPWYFIEDMLENDKFFLHQLSYIAGFLAVITFFSQLLQPAPYGRHDSKDGKWGPSVNQRIGHVLNDGLWGFIFYTLIFFGFYHNRGTINLTFSIMWLSHFFHRGFIHPFLMRYSSSTIQLGIPLTGLTLAYFSYVQARSLAVVSYKLSYFRDFRFILGVVLFVTGCIINRVADWELRKLRFQSNVKKYYIPRHRLFQLVSCPNYLGEMIQWLGWAIATWQPVGLMYFLFVSATFIPRSQHNHQWYLSKFKNYPSIRKALIPYFY